MRRMLFYLIPISLLLISIAHSSYFSTYCAPVSGAATGFNVNALAPWYCSQINQTLSSDWSYWEPIAFAAIMFSLAVGIIIWTFGGLLRNERLRTFGLGELYEAFATAIIVVLFLFISAVMLGLLPSVVVGNINPYTTSLTYIASTINSVQQEVYSAFYIEILDRYYSSIRLQVCILEVCQGIPETFAYIINYLYYIPAFTIIDLLLDGIMLLYGEFYLIQIFLYMAIPVFLIPGIILRAIMPTRGIGGMMIAIAIGFYVVMPILFATAYAFSAKQLINQFDANTAQFQQYGQGTDAQINALTPSSPLIETLTNIQSQMGSFWLAIVFWPSLIIGISYEIIVQIAEFIGGMAQGSGRMRI